MNIYNLERFIQAQEETFNTAFAEIQDGRKKSHWMWFIFPQLRGIGKSNMSYVYGIADLKEAKAYLADPVLGPRLERISEELLKLEEHDPEVIFGTIDAMKLHSCMTLFAQTSNEQCSVFNKVLQQYFHGKEDEKTLSVLMIQQFVK